MTYQKGSNHHNFKGDKVGYSGLHYYIRRHYRQPERCQDCKKQTINLDLACVTGEYTRDFVNWKYLCRSCHWKRDLAIPQDRKCCICHSTTTYTKKDGRFSWYAVNKEKNLYQCGKCYWIERRKKTASVNIPCKERAS